MEKDNFYDVEEIKDFNLLKIFNNKLNIKDLGQAPKKWYYDASGYTNLEQYVEMELKNRNGKLIDNKSIELKNKKTNKIYTATTVYIEPQHYSRMIDDYRFDGIIPMYINFLEDNTIIVWNLSTLKKKPEWKYVKHIWDEGKKEYKDEWRILLPVDEAYIYNKDYILISKPQ